MGGVAALAILAALPSPASASDAQVAALVSRGITLLNNAKARPAISGLGAVEAGLVTTDASSPKGNVAKPLAERGFVYAMRQLQAQLKAAAELDAGHHAAAAAALHIPREWRTWPTLIRRAGRLLGLKVNLRRR